MENLALHPLVLNGPIWYPVECSPVQMEIKKMMAMGLPVILDCIGSLMLAQLEEE